MTFRLALVFLLFILGESLSAQKIPILSDPKVDSNYIDLLSSQWSLRWIGAFRGFNYRLRDRDNARSLRYKPNNRIGVGMGVSYRAFIFDFGVTLKVEEQKFSTDRFNMQGTLALNQHFIDFNVQTLSGLDLDEPSEELIAFREDMKVSNVGINYFYHSNRRRLSLRSAFVGDRIQKRSAGAITLGGYFNWYRMEADSSVVPSPFRGNFKPESLLTRYESTSFGLSIGAAYTWVLPNKFFLFASPNPGIGINIGTLYTEQGQYDAPVGPNLKLLIKTAFGYAGDRWYASLSFTNDFYFFNIDNNNRYRYDPGRLKLAIGYRLRSKLKILEKADELFRKQEG